MHVHIPVDICMIVCMYSDETTCVDSRCISINFSHIKLIFHSSLFKIQKNFVFTYFLIVIEIELY